LNCVADKVSVLPLAGVILRSLSKIFVNSSAKSFNPAKPESTTKRAMDPMITATTAMPEMMLTAFLLLLEKRYRFAM